MSNHHIAPTFSQEVKKALGREEKYLLDKTNLFVRWEKVTEQFAASAITHETLKYSQTAPSASSKQFQKEKLHLGQTIWRIYWISHQKEAIEKYANRVKLKMDVSGRPKGIIKSNLNFLIQKNYHIHFQQVGKLDLAWIKASRSRSIQSYSRIVSYESSDDNNSSQSTKARTKKRPEE